MAFIPVNPPAVLCLYEDLDKWNSLLQAVDSQSTSSFGLPSLTLSESAGKDRCALCWEPEPVVFSEEKINAYLKACGHRCCYECFLRWVFLCREMRCPICMANEVTSKINSKLLDISKDKQGSDIALHFLHTDQPNDAVVFTRKCSTDEVAKCVSGEEANMKLFLKWDTLRFFVNRDEGDIPKSVIRLLQFECKDCGRIEELFNMCFKEYLDFPFINEHTKTHDQVYCELCFFEGTKFAKEFEQFVQSASSFKDHLEQCHHKCTLCPFTRYFYTKDALINHCRGAHHFCLVCDSSDLFFPADGSLFEHINSQHFVCKHCPKTVRNLVAFKTVHKLLEHHMFEHPKVAIEERFEPLFQVEKNVLECEDTPRRVKLDALDGLLRKLSAQGIIN